MKSKWLTTLGLALFCLIIFMPPLIHGYVYPNVGDDTASHLAVFDRMRAGDSVSSQFILSYKLVGYPLIWLSDSTKISIDTLFLWFNYLSLALIGITLYFVFSKLLNRMAGWLAIVLTLFCAQGILFQFYYGQIFNAINMGIILPILLYFLVGYIKQGRVYQLVLSLLISGLFGSFHTSGIYLPFVAGFVTVAYVVYSLIKKRHISKRLVLFGSAISIIPMVLFILFVPMGLIRSISLGDAFPISPYLMSIVSPTLLVFIAFSLIYFKDIRNGLTRESRIIAFLLGGMAIVLAVAAFTRLSLDPFRQALDLSTILALILVAIVPLDKMLKAQNHTVAIVLLLVIGLGLGRNVPDWFNYNSAVTKVDLQAINYVNTLDAKDYHCSSGVAYWIYNRFTKAKSSENATDVLITRNIPMTPASDPKNKWYSFYGFQGTDNYTLLKSFSDGKVKVSVYGK